MKNSGPLKPRLKAAGVHLLLSATVAACAAALVFGLWYPGPYRLLSGGRDLFFLVVSVDVVLGPLLTLVIFNLNKGWPHLRKDLAVIGLVQLAGLGYGLHTVYIARPVAMVFEMDRFRVITAADVLKAELPQALPEYRQLPLTGPWLISIRDAQKGEERNQALFLAVLKGVDTSQRPIFWQPYATAQAQAVQKSRPIDDLRKHYAKRQAEIDNKLGELHLKPGDARFLPVIARGDWVAVMDTQGQVLGYLPFDGYF